MQLVCIDFWLNCSDVRAQVEDEDAAVIGHIGSDDWVLFQKLLFMVDYCFKIWFLLSTVVLLFSGC